MAHSRPFLVRWKWLMFSSELDEPNDGDNDNNNVGAPR